MTSALPVRSRSLDCFFLWLVGWLTGWFCLCLCFLMVKKKWEGSGFGLIWPSNCIHGWVHLLTSPCLSADRWVFLIKLRRKLPAISGRSKFSFLDFPVTRFTAPQAELYEAVLEVQRDCLTLCCPGTSLETVYSMMLTLISRKLKELGITKNIKEKNPFKVFHVLWSQFFRTPDMLLGLYPMKS